MTTQAFDAVFYLIGVIVCGVLSGAIASLLFYAFLKALYRATRWCLDRGPRAATITSHALSNFRKAVNGEISWKQWATAAVHTETKELVPARCLKLGPLVYDAAVEVIAHGPLASLKLTGRWHGITLWRLSIMWINPTARLRRVPGYTTAEDLDRRRAVVIANQEEQDATGRYQEGDADRGQDAGEDQQEGKGPDPEVP